jgi:phosphate-selective porin OprO and OprP
MLTRVSRLALRLLAGTALLSPNLAFASEQELRARIENQQQEIEDLKKLVHDLVGTVNRGKKAENKEKPAARAEAPAQAPVQKTAADPAPHVTQSPLNKLAIESADGSFSIAPTGIVQVDVGGYLKFSPASPFVGPQHLSDGVNARRARIGVTGKMFGDWTYKFIYDGGNSQDTTPNGIEAAQVTYWGFPGVAIDLPGYSSTPFTLDQATSSNDLIFMERSTPANIAIGYNAGDSRTNTGARFFGDRYWVGAYFTGPASGDSHTGVSERFGAFQRAAFQVVSGPGYSIHLGGGASELLQAPDTGNGTAKAITLSDRPELRIDPTTLLTTGILGTATNPVTGGKVYNAEAAATWQNLMVQGEYFHYTLERRGLADNKFDGGYVQASWVLTGEQHNYDKTVAAYTGINPARPFSLSVGGIGAWELAARVSYVNLTDAFVAGRSLASQPDAVNGGQQTSYTFGLNWYPNSLLRFFLDYIHTDLKKANGTAVAGAPLGAPVGARADAIAFRTQFIY